MTPTTILIDTPAKRDRAVKWLAQIPVDEALELTLRPYKPTRSLQQNARLHKLFGIVADATGNSIEAVKIGYKAKFLVGEPTEFRGQKLMVYPRTSKMNTKELAQFMDQVESDAIAEFGVWLE